MFTDDADGDGVSDVLVGGLFSVSLLHGGALGDVPVSEAIATLSSPSENTGGGSLAVGDMNGDGVQDYIIGGETMWIVLGPISGDVDLDQEAQATFLDEGMAWQVAIPGDLNGDARDDLLVTTPYYSDLSDPRLPRVGGAFIITDIGQGTQAVGDAGLYLDPEGDMTSFGGVAGAGDVNGDGQADILVGSDADGRSKSVVWFLEGPLSAGLPLAWADAIIEGGESEFYGMALNGVGDLDGDGYDDIVMGEPTNSDVAWEAGALRIFHGPISGSMVSSQADTTWYGDQERGMIGLTANGAGDVDGDGFGEVLIGGCNYGETDDPKVGGLGAAWLVRGITTGTASVADASRRFYGSEDMEYLGIAVAGGADATSDGIPDLLITALEVDDTHMGLGSVYLFSGADLY